MKKTIRSFLILFLAGLMLSGSCAFAASPDEVDLEIMSYGWPGVTWVRTREESEDSSVRILEETEMDGYPVSVMIHAAGDPDLRIDEVFFTAHCSQMKMDDECLFPRALHVYNALFHALNEGDPREDDYFANFNSYDFLNVVEENGGTLHFEGETFSAFAEITGEYVTFHLIFP